MTSATAEAEKQAVDNQSQELDQETTAPSYDDINTPVILMVGAISVIITICTIFFVQGLYYQWVNGYIRDRSLDYVNEPVREIVEGQKALLNGNAEKGIVSVEETMKKVIEEFGEK